MEPHPGPDQGRAARAAGGELPRGFLHRRARLGGGILAFRRRHRKTPLLSSLGGGHALRDGRVPAPADGGGLRAGRPRPCEFSARHPPRRPLLRARRAAARRGGGDLRIGQQHADRAADRADPDAAPDRDRRHGELRAAARPARRASRHRPRGGFGEEDPHRRRAGLARQARTAGTPMGRRALRPVRRHRGLGDGERERAPRRHAHLDRPVLCRGGRRGDEAPGARGRDGAAWWSRRSGTTR